MEKAVLTAYATYTARLAMILRLIIVIEQIADEACIFSEADSAFLAIYLDLLACVAFRTDQLLQLLSVERVRLGVIVTETATVNLPATWTLRMFGKVYGI